MSDITVEIPAEIVISRAGGSVRYVPTAFKRGAKAKQGKMYPAIDPNTTNEELVNHIGWEDVRNMLFRGLNLFAQNYYDSATTGLNEKGDPIPKAFDLEEFTKYATELSARGLSKDDLNEAISAGCDAIRQVVLDVNIEPAAKMEKLKALTERLKNLNLDLASRKRTKDTESEEAAS